MIFGKGLYLLFASATEPSLLAEREGRREGGRQESPGCTEEPLEIFFRCAIHILTWKLIYNALERK